MELIPDAIENILKYASYGNDGLNWYFDAHNFCKNLAALYDTDLKIVAGVTAALSPQNKWDSNKTDCINLLESKLQNEDSYSVKVSTFNLNKSKAIDIMFGYGTPLEILKGNKTRSFYRNILDPYNPDIVTIDRHAIAVALGERITDENRLSYYKRTDKRYNQMVEYYKTAATYKNILPNQIQAITWVNYRMLHKVV